MAGRSESLYVTRNPRGIRIQTDSFDGKRRSMVPMRPDVGSGKTTLGKGLEEVLGWRFADTGPMSDEDLQEIIAQASDGLILTGRSLARHLKDPLARFWLECPLEVRAKRRGESADSLAERDAMDRNRGRLIPPDILAKRFDTHRLYVDETVAAAERFVRAQLRRVPDEPGAD